MTILDKAGNVVVHVGTNTAEGIGGNRMPPEQWRACVDFGTWRFAVGGSRITASKKNSEGDSGHASSS